MATRLEKQMARVSRSSARYEQLNHVADAREAERLSREAYEAGGVYYGRSASLFMKRARRLGRAVVIDRIWMREMGYTKYTVGC